MPRNLLHGWFEASRRFGFHNLPPPPAKQKLPPEYTAVRDAFRQARLDGHVPEPDVLRGKTVYLWRESTIDEWAKANAYDSRKRQKKARQRANAAEPKANATSQNEVLAAEIVPRSAKAVKRNAVQHG